MFERKHGDSTSCISGWKLHCSELLSASAGACPLTVPTLRIFSQPGIKELLPTLPEFLQLQQDNTSGGQRSRSPS